MKNLCLLFLFALMCCMSCRPGAEYSYEKPRVIVMTDGEIDDQSSMVRFLMYASDMDVLAIIETNSVHQRSGHSVDGWLAEQLDAYETVYPNLVKHNPDFPTAQYLRSISVVGDEDSTHLYGVPQRDQRLLIPGAPVIATPEDWADTPGSDKIVEILLEDNPAPVFIQAWGGGNTAARAFYKLQQEYPDQYKRAVSKAVMHNIWYQDVAGNYIENYHPDVTMLYNNAFVRTWMYGRQSNTYELIELDVKNGHGPLGALYPQDYVSEGDSPAFLYNVVNGLRNDEAPGFGGWGGRYEKFDQFEGVYYNAEDDGDIAKPLGRWIQTANNDFVGRMDWCIADDFSKANHAPMAVVKEGLQISVRSGKTVRLDGRNSSDPDGDEIAFNWWQYLEAGSYGDYIALDDPASPKVSFVAPAVSEPQTIHLILEVADNGTPSMTGYHRVVIEVLP